ncbi:MAG: hypothetical protein V3W41_17210 [Planctomycetota bacterium]
MTVPTRRIIKKGRIQVGAPTLGLSVGIAASETASRPQGPEPSIVLHREGDEIKAIEVACSCGKTIIIECEYSEETTP